MQEKVVHRHVFQFNPRENGGTALILTTEFVYNGDSVPLIRQELSLESYSNCATFTLNSNLLNSTNLRELAYQLEQAQHAARMAVAKEMKNEKGSSRDS